MQYDATANLRLRPYKPCDAKEIVTWCKDEFSFRQWSADRWETYPLMAESMNKKYIEDNGDCEEEDNFYCDILGEKWKCIEMYAEKENCYDYM